MTDTSPSIKSRHESGIAWIEIDRPNRRNALDLASRELLADAFSYATEDDDIRVVVLRGKGGAFSAGVDLKEERPASETHPLLEDQEPLVGPLQRCPKPIIGAIDGPAIGGGFELALTCEIRIATPRSFFALTEIQIGSLPGSGGTQRLFSALPSAVAWRILLTGERLSAERAYEVGLVSDLVPEGQFDGRMREVASTVARAAPLSLRAAKVAGQAAGSASEKGLAIERALWAFLATTADRQEGRAAFREKRQPRFEGH